MNTLRELELESALGLAMAEISLLRMQRDEAVAREEKLELKVRAIKDRLTTFEARLDMILRSVG